MQDISSKKSNFKQKILQFLDFKGISKYDFYKKTGITRGVLDSNSGLSEDNTTKFLAYFTEVNPIWFLTGNGDMIINSSSTDTQSEDPLHVLIDKLLDVPEDQLMGNKTWRMFMELQFKNKYIEDIKSEIEELRKSVEEKLVKK